MKTVQQYTYDILRKNDINIVFGNPGSNELPFLSNFPDDFTYILGLHEGAVLGIADGYAQASGKPAFINLHSAAGTGNAMGILTNSWNLHTPLIITAGQQTREMIGVEALLTNIDATTLPKPLVKWSYEPAIAQDVPLSISRAINLAKAEPAGPVYVSIPYNDWDMQASNASKHLLDKSVYSSQNLSESQLKVIQDAMTSAKKIALVYGPDVDRQNGYNNALDLAEYINAPVWIAPSAPRCSFPTSHPLFQGMMPASISGISNILEPFDLVLVFGAPVFRYHQYMPGEYLAPNTSLISFTCDPQEAARAPMGISFICDLNDALIKIKNFAPKQSTPVPIRKKSPLPAPSNDYLHPEIFMELLNKYSPENVTYVNESTSTNDTLWSRLHIKGQGGYFFAAAGGLGYGMPAAIGIQLAKPEKQVVAIIGDGSANYSITALWTATQYNIPVIYIILNNGTYGALRWFAGVLKADNVPGMDVPNIDFCSLAKGYGVKAVKVHKSEDFIHEYQKALLSQKPMLIEVITAPQSQ